MRKCDILEFELDGVAKKKGFERLFRQVQVCEQLLKQKRDGYITDGICMREKGISNFKYFFYLKDYEKRKQKDIVCATMIIVPKSLDNPSIREMLERLTDTYITLLEINSHPLEKKMTLRKKRIYLNSIGLKEVLSNLWQKRIEEKLERQL